MITLDKLIQNIELCQPVINKQSLLSLDKSVNKVADLSSADDNSIAFLSSAKYSNDLAKTKAGIVLISQQFADNLPEIPTIFVVVADAYLAHASISALFAYPNKKIGIHQTAIVAKTAKLGSDVVIGAYSVIGDDVVIGDGVHIENHAVVDDDAVIGNNCFIASGVHIHHQCQIGQNVRIHAGASIGAEGFGFAPHISKEGLMWQRIAQLGKVVIGDNVRIGANTCIDRGAVGDTVIEKNVIIDNLVQIAHNVVIKSGTAIAAKTGIAGSTIIGKNCIIGGAVGIAGHLTIADGVTLTGMTMVTGSIKESGTYSSGIPAMPSAKWRRAAVKFRQSGDK